MIANANNIMDEMLKEIGRMEIASQEVLANLEKMAISAETDADLLYVSLTEAFAAVVRNLNGFSVVWSSEAA